MKKTTFSTFTVASMMAFMTAISMTSCDSAATKSDKADAKVEGAKDDLKDAQKEASTAATKAANEAEWQAFKAETQVRMDANDAAIAELKTNMKKAGKKVDAAYTETIEKLQQKNKDFKAKMDNYETQKSDWASFKTEFNHDMDELGNALKDLTVNNKK
jgi:F0F1-type ATP synthase membrane subunit b/b'